MSEVRIPVSVESTEEMAEFIADTKLLAVNELALDVADFRRSLSTLRTNWIDEVVGVIAVATDCMVATDVDKPRLKRYASS